MTPANRLFLQMVRDWPKRWFVQKIETSTGVGTPDVFVCADGHEFWVELKASGDYLSREQWAWAARYMDAGGVVFIYCVNGWIIPSADMIGKRLK